MKGKALRVEVKVPVLNEVCGNQDPMQHFVEVFEVSAQVEGLQLKFKLYLTHYWPRVRVRVRIRSM